jgi:hypothetical protein
MWTASGILVSGILVPARLTRASRCPASPDVGATAGEPGGTVISVTETAAGAAESVTGAVTGTETGAAESAAGVADSLNRA